MRLFLVLFLAVVPTFVASHAMAQDDYPPDPDETLEPTDDPDDDDDGSGVQGVGGDNDGALGSTGADVLTLIIWGLVLLSVGTALTVATWRAAHGEPVLASRRRGPPMFHPKAKFDPEVPQVDTSDFVPIRESMPQKARPAVPAAKATVAKTSATATPARREVKPKAAKKATESRQAAARKAGGSAQPRKASGRAKSTRARTQPRRPLNEIRRSLQDRLYTPLDAEEFED